MAESYMSIEVHLANPKTGDHLKLGPFPGLAIVDAGCLVATLGHEVGKRIALETLGGSWKVYAPEDAGTTFLCGPDNLHRLFTELHLRPVIGVSLPDRLRIPHSHEHPDLEVKGCTKRALCVREDGHEGDCI